MPVPKKVRQRVNHNSLSLHVEFSNRQVFTFRVTRKGEVIKVLFSTLPATVAQLKEGCKLKPSETHGQRLERMARAAHNAETLEGFAGILAIS